MKVTQGHTWSKGERGLEERAVLEQAGTGHKPRIFERRKARLELIVFKKKLEGNNNVEIINVSHTFKRRHSKHNEEIP